jgi:hypothetical protein
MSQIWREISCMEAFLFVAVPDGVGSGSVPTLTLFLEPL